MNEMNVTFIFFHKYERLDYKQQGIHEKRKEKKTYHTTKRVCRVVGFCTVHALLQNFSFCTL